MDKSARYGRKQTSAEYGSGVKGNGMNATLVRFRSGRHVVAERGVLTEAGVAHVVDVDERHTEAHAVQRRRRFAEEAWSERRQRTGRAGAVGRRVTAGIHEGQHLARAERVQPAGAAAHSSLPTVEAETVDGRRGLRAESGRIEAGRRDARPSRLLVTGRQARQTEAELVGTVARQRRRHRRVRVEARVAEVDTSGRCGHAVAIIQVRRLLRVRQRRRQTAVTAATASAVPVRYRLLFQHFGQRLLRLVERVEAQIVVVDHLDRRGRRRCRRRQRL